MLPVGRHGSMMEMTLCVDDEPAARRALGLVAVELAGAR
jgi:hypothetical protein